VTNSDNPPAYPPETIEGWYCLHQIFRNDARVAKDSFRGASKLEAALACDRKDGWSACVRLIGSSSNWMLLHFRPTLEAIAAVQARVALLPVSALLKLDYSFLSVTEAGLYHTTAQLAREAAERGGKLGDEEYRRALQEKVKAELASAHVQKRLYPELPKSMPYVCFYPMNKKREAGQNWYILPLDERSRLMHAHGLTGRKYAGKIFQVITGAIGFDAWEWGVTLFASDPLEFKKLVTEMRFDEVSAKYAEFGDFYVGKVVTPEEWGSESAHS
jgi:Uncharacterized conserved protein